MPRCCGSGGCDKFFGRRLAARDVRGYRRGGLAASARRITDFLVGQGVDGQTLLEIGGGIGALQVELLRAGVASATSVELSPNYESEARRLLQHAGFKDRVERHVADFAQEPDAFEPADIVVMHRVICCYQDMEGLVSAAAARTRGHLALAFPRDRWWLRAGFRSLNVACRLRRLDFRVFVHQPREIVRVAGEAGLQPVFSHSGRVWQLLVLQRAATTLDGAGADAPGDVVT